MGFLKELKLAQRTSPTKVSLSRPASDHLKFYIKVGGWYVYHNNIHVPLLCWHYEFRQRMHEKACKMFGVRPIDPALARWC